MIPNPNGPAIMVCSHPVDKHIVRIVAVADLAMKHVINAAQAEVTGSVTNEDAEAVKLPCSRLPPPQKR